MSAPSPHAERFGLEPDLNGLAFLPGCGRLSGAVMVLVCAW